VFTPDDKRMLVSVGSRSNDAEGLTRLLGDLQSWWGKYPLGASLGTETDRAAVLIFDPNGNRVGTFATGIRNCVGLAVHPASGDVYCSTNERDGLGDDLVPDYVTRVREGAFYGWPWFYIGDNHDPRHAGERADLKERSPPPTSSSRPTLRLWDWCSTMAGCFRPNIAATVLQPNMDPGIDRSAPVTR
jgi:glucose/arabinose dehydrogenase